MVLLGLLDSRLTKFTEFKAKRKYQLNAEKQRTPYKSATQEPSLGFHPQHSKVQATMYSQINSTTGNYSGSVAFI